MANHALQWTRRKRRAGEVGRVSLLTHQSRAGADARFLASAISRRDSPPAGRTGGELLGLFSGLPSSVREGWLVLALQVYVDDSGSGTEGPVYVLSGYVSSVEQWSTFSDEWKRQLQAPPHVEYFKMKEAESRRGQFWHWSAEQRDHQVVSLALLIKPRVMHGVECVVAQKHYDAVIRPFAQEYVATSQEDREVLEMLQDPYFFCFYGIISECLKRLRMQGMLQPVDFFFDEQGKIGQRASNHWDEIKRFSPLEFQQVMVSRPVFRDDKVFLPLQAADLIAWQTRRAVDERLRGKKELREVTKALREIPSFVNRWNKRRLREFLNLIETP